MQIGLPVDVWRPIHVEATASGLVGLPRHIQVLGRGDVITLMEVKEGANKAYDSNST